MDVSSGVRSSMGALNRIYDTEEKRPKALRFGTSVAIAIAVILLFVGALLAVLAAPNVASHGLLRWPVAVLRWPVAVLLLGTAIALLVRFGPAEHPRARWATAGGAVVIVAWVVASLIFRFYVSSVANFKSAAGVLVAVLVLTTYLYVIVDHLPRRGRARRAAAEVGARGEHAPRRAAGDRARRLTLRETRERVRAVSDVRAGGAREALRWRLAAPERGRLPPGRPRSPLTTMREEDP